MAEAAFLNPLLVEGIILIPTDKAFVFSPVLGVIPILLYLFVELEIREYRKRTKNMVNIENG